MNYRLAFDHAYIDFTAHCPARSEDVTISIEYLSGTKHAFRFRCPYHNGIQVCGYFMEHGVCPVYQSANFY